MDELDGGDWLVGVSTSPLLLLCVKRLCCFFPCLFGGVLLTSSTLAARVGVTKRSLSFCWRYVSSPQPTEIKSRHVPASSIFPIRPLLPLSVYCFEGFDGIQNLMWYPTPIPAPVSVEILPWSKCPQSEPVSIPPI